MHFVAWRKTSNVMGGARSRENRPGIIRHCSGGPCRRGDIDPTAMPGNCPSYAGDALVDAAVGLAFAAGRIEQANAIGMRAVGSVGTG